MSRARAPRRIGREHLTVTVDPATTARLDALAAELGLSRGRIVDEAIVRLRAIVEERGGIAFLAAPQYAGNRKEGT